MTLYSVSLRKEVVARHRLRVEGPESSLHSHAYAVEVKVSGAKTDKAGFLIDIRELEQAFDTTLSEFRDAVLNEQEGFAAIEPSLENFCRVVWRRMRGRLDATRVKRLAVTIWENPMASASYEERLER